MNPCFDVRGSLVAGSLERAISIYGDFVTTVILNNNYLGAIFVNFDEVWSLMSGSKEKVICRLLRENSDAFLI